MNLHCLFLYAFIIVVAPLNWLSTSSGVIPVEKIHEIIRMGSTKTAERYLQPIIHGILPFFVRYKSHLVFMDISASFLTQSLKK